MTSKHDDRDLPVPDPDGSPIHPRELAAAEGRMLSDLEREEPPVFQEPNGDPTAAQQVIERHNSRTLTDDDAAAYRLAPDDTLDWLSSPISAQDEAALERWEDHLDWLEPSIRPSPASPEEGPFHEPEHERR